MHAKEGFYPCLVGRGANDPKRINSTQMHNFLEISIVLIFIAVKIRFKFSPTPSHLTPDIYVGVLFGR